MKINKIGNNNLAESSAYILIILALLVGFVIRFLSLFQYTTFDIGPAPDQVRDAFVYMNMWQGKLPTLGPSASVGGYHLPPLYYYLVFPFTILGADPRFQVLPNTLFSFLSIPLLIYLVYELLKNINYSYRILLAGLAGFWYSLIFGEIFISTFQWNPSPIPFFLMSFILIYKTQLESKFFQKSTEIILWILYGIDLAILVSLHSTTMFVMPLIFIASLIFFAYKNCYDFQKLFLSSFSFIFALIALLPYWQGEINRNFSNSKQIIMTIFASKNEVTHFSIWQRLSSVIFNYFELGQQAYFVGNSWIYILVSIIFLSLVLYFGIAKFQGNNIIFILFGFTWLLYLYAASNFQGTFFIHYKLLFLLSPLIFTVITLAYLDYSKTLNIVISIIVIFGIIFSCWSNLSLDYRYLLSKYGSDRLISTTDVVNILNQVPKQSTICEPNYSKSRTIRNPYNYIDMYITKRQLKIVNDCFANNYILHTKYKMIQSMDYLWPVFEIKANQFKEKNYSLYLDTSVAQVYIKP
jgi:hypothetical protein